MYSPTFRRNLCYCAGEFNLELKIREVNVISNTKYQELYTKPYVVGIHENRLIETILMSNSNIGFGRELMD